MTPYLHETIFDLLAIHAGQRANAVAIETGGVTSLTYGEVFSRAKTLIRALNARGVVPGSRVAIVLPNGADLAVSMLAVSAFATSVPFNPAYRRDEYQAYCGDIRVTHLLTLQNFPSEARTVAMDRKIPILELAGDGSMTLADDG